MDNNQLLTTPKVLLVQLLPLFQTHSLPLAPQNLLPTHILLVVVLYSADATALMPTEKRLDFERSAVRFQTPKKLILSPRPPFDVFFVHTVHMATLLQSLNLLLVGSFSLGKGSPVFRSALVDFYWKVGLELGGAFLDYCGNPAPYLFILLEELIFMSIS